MRIFLKMAKEEQPSLDHDIFHDLLDDHIIQQVRAVGVYQRDLLEAIRSLGLRGTYMDLGANIGTCSVYFLRFCAAEEVVCVEARQEIAAVLAANMSAQGSIKPFAVIVSPVAGYNERAAASPVCHVNTGRTSVTPGHGIATTRLSTLLKMYHPTLIKIDLQGYELASIREALQEIALHLPVLAVRFMSEQYGDEDFAETNVLLRGIGYDCFGPWCSSPYHIWVHSDDECRHVLSGKLYPHNERLS